MKLEVGKYYKSRNGHKWKCVYIFNDRERNNVLLIDEKKCENVIYTNLNGTVFNNDITSYNDLISEWVEPVEHEVEVWFYKWGTNITCSPSYLKFNGDGNQVLIAKVKVKFTEGEGL